MSIEIKLSEISPLMDTKDWIGVDYCYFNATPPEEYKDVNNSSVIRAIMKSSGKTSSEDFRAIYDDLYSIKEDFDRVNVPIYYLKNFDYTITSFIYPLTSYTARNADNEVLNWMRNHQKGNYIICVGDYLQHVFAYIDGTIYDKYVNPFDAIGKITTSNQKYIVWIAERT